MTVAELIAALQRFAPGLAVCVPNAEGDFDEVDLVTQQGVVFLDPEEPNNFAEPEVEQCVVLQSAEA